jgi:8-oxo-dGTP diphosphatase
MTHEVVAALIVRSGQILLGQRAANRALYPGVWDLFGGHLEPGEKIEQTLVRELQEELGITPTTWTFLETLSLPLPARGGEPADQIIVHLYLLTAWSGTPVNRQPEEHTSIDWFSLEQALQLELADSIYPELFARYLKKE